MRLEVAADPVQQVARKQDLPARNKEARTPWMPRGARAARVRKVSAAFDLHGAVRAYLESLGGLRMKT